MADRIAVQLFKVGTAAGRRSSSSGLRSMALISAVLVIGLGLLALLTIHAAQQGNSSRASEIQPVFTDAESAPLLMFRVTDELADRFPYTVVFVDPRTPDAPVPPGVTEWPEPGEVLLSNGLLDAGRDEGIEERYGRFAGLIGDEGAIDGIDRMAYVVVDEPLSLDDALGVTSFGGPVTQPTAFHRNDSPNWMLLALASMMLIAPGLVLVATAARIGAETRDRRIALVSVLGARRIDRVAVIYGEAWRPVAIGTAAVAMAGIVVATTDIRIPVTGYLVSAADIRAYGLWFLAAVIATPVLVLGLIAILGRGTSNKARRTGVRPVSRPSRWFWLIALISPCATLLAINPQWLVDPRSPQFMPLGFAATLVATLTLPVTIAAILAAIGVVVASIGWRFERASALISGRSLQTRARSSLRLVSGVAVAVVLFIHAVAWLSNTESRANVDLDRAAAVGHEFVLVEPTQLEGDTTTDELNAFTSALPDGHTVVVLATKVNVEISEPDRVHVRGECADLRRVGLPCTGEIDADASPKWLSAHAHGGVGVIEAVDYLDESALERPYALLVANDSGDALDLAIVKQATFDGFTFGGRIHQFEYNDPTGMMTTVPWLVLFAGIVVVILAWTSALSGASEFVANGRTLAPITVLSGSFRVFRSTALWTVGFPIVIAAAIAALVGILTSWTVDHQGSGYVTPTLLGALIGVAASLAVVMSIGASTEARRQARSWRPGGD